MLPIISRSSIMRSCREFLKYNSAKDDDCSKTPFQSNLDCFLTEKATLQEKLENDFFGLMTDYKSGALDYVEEIGKIDPELPGKNPEQFDKLLDYFWDRISTVFDLDVVLDTVCNAFPNYERIVLKSAYMAFMNGEIEASYEFAILLERMSDYDQIDEINHFSSDIDGHLNLAADEPVINLCDTREVTRIFDILVPFSPFADVMWILENRFNIDHDFLSNLAYMKICELYEEYNASELERDNAFNELFKLAKGYELFELYLPNVMCMCTATTFNKLIDNYGLYINMAVKRV